jgi:putative flippase GtrA
MTAEPEKPAPVPRHSVPRPLSRAGSAFGEALLRILPEPVRRRLQTEAGKRFMRFVPVAIAALLSSQITLAVLVWMDVTAGKAALCASIVGALVSYLLSRWAWERKGRPDLLRETVPFWAVSLAVWGVLSLTSHYAGAFAKHEHLHHLARVGVVNGAYLAANCITFVTRFLIFHYFLFANRRRPALVTEVAPAAPGAANGGAANGGAVTMGAAGAGGADAGPDGAPQMALATDSTAQPKPKA